MIDKEVIDVLFSLKNNKVLEPYISYIRFPYYKNLNKDLKIDFDFPLTAIVGQNGTNKSSILRAIYGCPKDYSVGNFWFSTDVDPISEDGGRARFIYSYYQKEAKRDVEVIKTRIRYVNRTTKKVNPDYWEPARPSIKDGMEKMPKLGSAGREKTRWKLMEKNVVFMDFRSEISAYDKYFYHGDLKETLRHGSKQDFIRSKSKLIKDAVDKELKTKRMYKGKKEQILKNILIPDIQVSVISKILGRSYKEIRVISHRFFKKTGETIILKSDDLTYSEAFAGSGEFSVVMLVHRLSESVPHSLIILDEPEVSLHPGAQERLIDFLLGEIKSKKHQIVVGTHSPYILSRLPAVAIKTLYMDPVNKKISVTNETTSEEAFFHLEAKNVHKHIIFVEDRLAGEVVKRALRILGEAIFKKFKITYLPGGASVLLMKYLPAYAITSRTDSIFILDGDQKPNHDIKSIRNIELLSSLDIKEKVNSILGGKFEQSVDSGNAENKEKQERSLGLSILEFCRQYVDYLPDNTPEEFVWNNMQYDISSYQGLNDNKLSYKARFEALCKIELGRESYEDVTSDEIFQMQQRCLATLDESLFATLVGRIKLHCHD